MGCCGGGNKKANQSARAVGLADVYRLPAEKCTEADERIRRCHTCEYQTWLFDHDYAAHFANLPGDTLIQRLAVSAALPISPRSDDRRGAKLFCSLSKLFVPAQAFRPAAKCPKGYWGR